MNKKHWLEITSILLLPCIMVAALSWLVFYNAVNVPVWDAWSFVKILDQYHSGVLTFSDFFTVQNGHRLLIPKILMLSLADITNWDVRYELVLNLIFATTGFLAYFFILRKSGLSPLKQGVAAVCFALLYFSLVQFENWYWGWQMALFIAASFSVITLLLVSNSNSVFILFLAFISGLLASFSFANALLVFPLGLIILLYRKQAVSHLIIWSGFCIFSFLAFFYDYPFKQLSGDSYSPISYAQYTLIYLGSPFAGDNMKAAMLIGSGGLFALFYLFYELHVISHQSSVISHQSIIIGFFSVGLFIILSAIVTALARLKYGLDGALLSRYTSFSLHFWIAITGLLFLYLSTDRNTVKTDLKIYSIIALCAISIGSVHASYTRYDEFSIHHKRTSLALKELKAIDQRGTNKNLIKNITWSNDFTLKQCKLLQKYHLSFYADEK